MIQIDRSRRFLLNKLKEYKGQEDCEVIHEAAAFAGEKIEHDEDGRAHCVVKERVEIPFDTNFASPNASYGLG